MSFLYPNQVGGIPSTVNISVNFNSQQNITQNNSYEQTEPIGFLLQTKEKTIKLWNDEYRPSILDFFFLCDREGNRYLCDKDPDTVNFSEDARGNKVITEEDLSRFVLIAPAKLLGMDFILFPMYFVHLNLQRIAEIFTMLAFGVFIWGII